MKLFLTFTAVDAASGVLLSLEKKILRMGKDAQKVRKDFEDMVSNARIGLKSLAASKYLFDTLKPLVKIAADTQEAFSELEMTIARAGESSEKLHAELEKIGDVTGKLQLLFPFGQKEMVQAATVMAQAGMKPEDLYSQKGALYSVGALASIGKVSTLAAANLVSTGANIFGIKGDEIGRMADWMQRIGTTTPLHIESQAHSLAEGGASAAMMGISYKDTLTAMGVAARQSGDSTTAGERFAEFGRRLMGATKQEKKALKEAGLSFYDSKGKMLPFKKIVEELQGFREKAEAKGFTEEKIHDLFKKIFEGRGEYMAWYLSKKGEGSFQDVEARAEQSISTEEKLVIALKDFNRQMEALVGSVNTLISDVLKPLLQDLTPIVMKINDLVGALDSFSKKHRELTRGITEAIGILGGAVALRGIYRLTKAARSLGKVIAGLGGSTEAAATGLTALSGAVGTLLQYLGPFMAGWEGGKKIEESREKYSDLREQMKGEFNGAKEQWDGIFRQNGGSPLQTEDNHLEQSVSKLGDIMKERQKNEINLNISVDQNGRVTSSSNDPNTSMKIDLKRGNFNFGPLTD
jgi:TP901 family phage tail tape measure protein